MNIPQHTLLFVFGTLLDAEVLRIVLGRDLPSSCRRCATLAEHSRLQLHDETYPVLVPMNGASVVGVVLTLSAADMARVRFFEAGEYELQAAQVHDSNGHMLDVFLCAESGTRPGPRYPWTLSQWQREHKRTFLEQAKRYMALYGTMRAEQANLLWKGFAGPD
jgi:gamma-glutamylcyclotransferase (GGCT)/AIG2-like uncharacterized protein YtfP